MTEPELHHDDAPPAAQPPAHEWLIPLWPPLRWLYFTTEQRPWLYQLTRALWWGRYHWLSFRASSLAVEHGIPLGLAAEVLTDARKAKRLRSG